MYIASFLVKICKKIDSIELNEKLRLQSVVKCLRFYAISLENSQNVFFRLGSHFPL